MTNLNRTVELLTSIALADNDKDKERFLKELRIISDYSNFRPSMEEEVKNILAEFGIPCTLAGYDYCVTAICMIVKEPNLKRGISYRLYPEVGKLFDVKGVNVERSIRTAIQAASNRAGIDVFHRYFGASVSPMTGLPTSSEFLCRLADEIRRRGMHHEMDNLC